MLVLSAPRVVTSHGVLAPGTVGVEDGRIVAVEVGSSLSGKSPGVVLESGVLAPGLVDLQINGCRDVDFVDATPDQWRTAAQWLATTGVTAFVPTFITAPVAELVAALGRGAAAARDLATDAAAAQPLGVHLEGPFLSERRRGAHDPAYLTDPTPEAIEALLAAGGLAILTLAPERVGALDAIRRLVAAGVLVSVGHSDATEAQVTAAADAGARMVTHLYNAQRPLHHREPGVVGAALTDGRLTSGLILDLHHVAPAAVRLAFAAAAGRIVLVTDAVSAAGMPPGRYVLGGAEVTLMAGEPPLRADGAIAGSALRLDEAVANAVAIGLDLPVALDAATRVPADLIGRPDLGRIAPGAVADLVWLGEDLRARATWRSGALVAGRLPPGQAA